MPFTLLRPHYLTIRNRFRFGARSAYGRRRDQLLLLIVVTIMFCIFAAVFMALRGLRQQEAFLFLLPTKLIELAALGFFILLLVSNTVAAIGNIYTSEHLNLILPTPTTSARIYLAKFVETFIETSVMFYVFTLPAVAAIVSALSRSWLFLPYYILVTLPFLLIPTAFAMSAATLLVNAFTLLWRRGQIFLVALAGSFVWAFWEIWRAIDVVRQTHSGSSVILKAVSIYENPNPFWLPSRWASDLLTAGLTGSYQLDSLRFGLLLATPVALAALGFLAFDTLMLRVRSSGQTTFTSPPTAARALPPAFQRAFAAIATSLGTDQQVQAIVRKDYSALLRDRSQALQLLLYLFIATTYVTLFNFMTAAFEMFETMRQAWSATLTSLNIVFAGFIVTTLMTRLVYPSVSLEGRAFWILQVTPLEVERMIRAKFWCWLPITTFLAVGLIVAGGLAVGLQLYQVPFFIVTGASLSAACTGLAIGFGARYANFHWEAPNQITVGLGTMVLLLSNVVLILLVAVPSTIVTWLLLIPKLRLIVGEINAFLAMVSCTFTIVFVSLLVARWAVKSGAKSLEIQRVAN